MKTYKVLLLSLVLTCIPAASEAVSYKSHFSPKKDKTSLSLRREDHSSTGFLRKIISFKPSSQMVKAPSGRRQMLRPQTQEQLLRSARSYIGTKEIRGGENKTILAFLSADLSTSYLRRAGLYEDETPWCAGFVNYVAKKEGFERPKSLKGRDVLNVGQRVSFSNMRKGDVVVVKYGPWNHCAFVNNITDEKIELLGGNQKNSVCILNYSKSYVSARFVGATRLRPVS